MKMRETYRPVLLAANASYEAQGSRISAFMAKTAGTITVTDKDTDTGTVVDAHPVTAGQYLQIPLHFETSMGGTVTLAGGASGTLLI